MIRDWKNHCSECLLKIWTIHNFLSFPPALLIYQIFEHLLLFTVFVVATSLNHTIKRLYIWGYTFPIRDCVIGVQIKLRTGFSILFLHLLKYLKRIWTVAMSSLFTAHFREVDIFQIIMKYDLLLCYFFTFFSIIQVDWFSTSMLMA